MERGFALVSLVLSFIPLAFPGLLSVVLVLEPLRHIALLQFCFHPRRAERVERSEPREAHEMNTGKKKRAQTRRRKARVERGFAVFFSCFLFYSPLLSLVFRIFSLSFKL